MKGKLQNHIIVLSIAAIVLTVFVAMMIHAVGAMQGNARVINYAGIVRGATQRLVKNELYGKQDNDEIKRLDDILIGLQTGKGSQNLTVLNDYTYNQKLNTLANEWKKVKSAIYDARSNNSKREQLYLISEAYFKYADETVSAAEKYSDGVAKKLNIYEILIIFDIIFILCSLSIQIVSDIKANMHLHKIAYVDPNTGLPNKRSCDEMLDKNIIIELGCNV